VGDYFEETLRHVKRPKAVSNWVMTDVLRTLSEQNVPITAFPIKPEFLGELIELTETKVINSNTAKQVFGIMLAEGGRAGEIVAARGLAQVSDAGFIEKVVDQVMAENPKSVEDYRSGKAAALKHLIGQVMRSSKGKANPQLVGELLEKKIGRG
jgi:aspartyl-tRNA(Asn)/glutamyl-tRNA(Gln) amidotransferase subunit B